MLLHFENSTTDSAPPSDAPKPEASPTVKQGLASLHDTNLLTVLLLTAFVEVQDSWGNCQTARAPLELASQANFLTEQCSQCLRSTLSASIIARTKTVSHQN
ncbi:hypothetical protein PR048_003094 [Dryococelus australis]|uniref:Uncharacterized protein n=1 Tax=Dryococelus australis TaxID=614101 RepID=A0ABQ9INF2_9NEOP|nr:hypothetical protein PR048_003094 [Dryococelus australis]